MLNGTIYNFFGTVMPDFGFPDKRIWQELTYMYPSENWDRGQVYDLYKWYQTGIENGQAPFDYDTGNTQVFEWMKQNSPYTSTKIDHFKNTFIVGVKDNWIEGKYVGTQLAPANEAREISEGTQSISAIPGNIFKGMDKITYIALAGTALLTAYYLLPVLTKRKMA